MDYRVYLEEELKKRIPRYQQGHEDLDQFLEAAGQYLDEIRDSINQFKYSDDYQKSTIRQLYSLADDLGINLDSGLQDDLMRLVVRDIIEVYRAKGTARTIEWIFKVIGLGVSLRYAWILNPETFVPPGEATNATFVYGHHRVYENGTYFDGEDIFGNVYKKVPIVGEQYPKNKRLSDYEVMKTPYIFLDIDADDYQEFISEAGTNNESVLNQIIANFFDEIRPANVVLSVVLTTPDYHDVIPWDTEDEKEMEIEGPLTLDGSWAVGITTGNYIPGEYLSNIRLHPTRAFDYYRNREESEDVPNDVFTFNFTRNNHMLVLRDTVVCDFEVNLPIGQEIRIEVSESDKISIGNGNGEWEELYRFHSSFSEDFYEKAVLTGKTALRMVVVSDEFTGTVSCTCNTYAFHNRLIETGRLEHVFSRDSNARSISPNMDMITNGNNVLRKTYNPNDGLEKGYLIESSIENRLRYSQNLISSVWQGADSGGVISTTEPSLDGTYFFRVRRNSGSSNFSGITQTVTGLEVGQIYTASVFATRGNSETASLYIDDGDERWAILTYNFNDGSFYVQESIIEFDDVHINVEGYLHDSPIYKLILTFRTNVDTLNFSLLSDLDDTSQGQYTFYWGAQLARGSESTYVRSDVSNGYRDSDKYRIPKLNENLTDKGRLIIGFYKDYGDHDYLLYLKGNDVATSIYFYVEGRTLFLNGMEIGTLKQPDQIGYNRNHLLIDYDNEGIEYTFYGEERTDGQEMFHGFNTDTVEVFIGSDDNLENQFDGIIKQVMVIPGEVDSVYKDNMVELFDGYDRNFWH